LDDLDPLEDLLLGLPPSEQFLEGPAFLLPFELLLLPFELRLLIVLEVIPPFCGQPALPLPIFFEGLPDAVPFLVGLLLDGFSPECFEGFEFGFFIFLCGLFFDGFEGFFIVMFIFFVGFLCPDGFLAGRPPETIPPFIEK